MNQSEESVALAESAVMKDTQTYLRLKEFLVSGTQRNQGEKLHHVLVVCFVAGFAKKNILQLISVDKGLIYSNFSLFFLH